MLGMLFTASTIVESVKTAAEGIKTDALAVIGGVAPIALAITAAFLGWKIGMKFFKKSTGDA